MATIGKILVANRGEIAARVLRTARRLGIRTVATYSDADRDQPFVHAADEAVRLGPPPARESYLDAEKILTAARKTGSDAIHPGYGFLSENAAFAEAVAAAGLTFIGPPARVIREMGDKRRARAHARLADVPVVPGFDEVGAPNEVLIARAAEIGFPVLVKASAGGGGKGMVVVREAAKLPEALESARRVAEAAFGDPSLFLEKYVDGSRHVEIQIFGDQTGRVIHLLERECSIQRRHQKIIEESPSVALDAELRQKMCDAAIRLGKAIGYENAGTVEMLVGPDRSFYFLEVNTRLQVEHPVTETLLGLDLVEMQIRVAEGRPLELTSVQPRGAALECRLCAEDSRTFLPATGRIRDFFVPEGVRVDTGVRTGSEVGIHYDPLLAKIITHGVDREDAIRKMRRVLEDASVQGVTHNRDLLTRILANPAFISGAIDTHFLDTHPELFEQTNLDRKLLRLSVAAFVLAAADARKSVLPTILPGYRNNRFRDETIDLQVGETKVSCSYRRVQKDLFSISIGAEAFEVRLVRIELPEVIFDDADGVRRRARVTLDGELDDLDPREVSCHLPSIGQLDFIALPRFPRPVHAHRSGAHVAPMPGRVVRVFVAEGQLVHKGDLLLILEAMKMEQPVRASQDGKVAAVLAREGDQVDADAELIVIEPI